ncbi:hypothetical protein J2744_003064 [Halorubrum trapanicum]|uniref:DNA polymerase sliding clamp n=1 Tax=Halorubrum trapanicum TaxID=29284 RepID=A0A8J7RAH8_9EURY|nr:hypothetical protein [Halorubrum trapanicum]MBP1903359.1 hypothetical protein [Halorubrum trapanicum]
MWSWLPTQASTDVSLRVTLDRDRLADLLAPVAAVGDEAVLRVTPDALTVRAADDGHTRSVTATIDADACSQYAVTPGRLAVDLSALRAAIAADATISAETDPVTLAYATDDPALTVSLPTVTHEQPVDPTPEGKVPQLSEWPGGATLHHRAEPLTEVCDYFAAIAEVVAVEYDGSRNAFRIERVAAHSADDAPRRTGTYERTADELPGETVAATVRATFDSALLRDLVAATPGDARLRLDIADAHPLRLGWTSTHPDQRGDTPVEVTALLAPRQMPARDDTDTE